MDKRVNCPPLRRSRRIAGLPPDLNASRNQQDSAYSSSSSSNEVASTSRSVDDRALPAHRSSRIKRTARISAASSSWSQNSSFTALEQLSVSSSNEQAMSSNDADQEEHSSRSSSVIDSSVIVAVANPADDRAPASQRSSRIKRTARISIASSSWSQNSSPTISEQHATSSSNEQARGSDGVDREERSPMSSSVIASSVVVAVANPADDRAPGSHGERGRRGTAMVHRRPGHSSLLRSYTEHLGAVPVQGESFCHCPQQGQSRDLHCTCGEEDQCKIFLSYFLLRHIDFLFQAKSHSFPEMDNLFP